MRALERGESPSVIQARIEAYRQDKPNPHYYAERTVSRALAYRALSASHPAPESSIPLTCRGWTVDVPLALDDSTR